MHPSYFLTLSASMSEQLEARLKNADWPLDALTRLVDAQARLLDAQARLFGAQAQLFEANACHTTGKLDMRRQLQGEVEDIQAVVARLHDDIAGIRRELARESPSAQASRPQFEGLTSKTCQTAAKGFTSRTSQPAVGGSMPRTGTPGPSSGEGVDIVGSSGVPPLLHGPPDEKRKAEALVSDGLACKKPRSSHCQEVCCNMEFVFHRWGPSHQGVAVSRSPWKGYSHVQYSGKL